jgi:hypothetical protein
LKRQTRWGSKSRGSGLGVAGAEELYVSVRPLRLDDGDRVRLVAAGQLRPRRGTVFTSSYVAADDRPISFFGSFSSECGRELGGRQNEWHGRRR